MSEFPESVDVSCVPLLDSAPGVRAEKSSYWHEHFANCESSGLSQSEYCRRHGLNYSVFHYWKRKLRKPSHPQASLESESVNFVEVGSPLPFGAGLPLRPVSGDFFRLWVGDICVELGAEFDPRSLSELVRCLRGR